MLGFTLSLLLAVAQGAPAPQQSPAITSAAALPRVTHTIYMRDESPVTCTNHLLQFCDRPEFPHFANGQIGAAEYNNPYTIYKGYNYTDEQTSASFSCQSSFFTAYEDYYKTAAITFGPEVPAETILSGYTSTGTFTYSIPSRVSTGFYTTYYTLTVPLSTGTGETTFVKTVVNSAGIQVLTTVTASFDTDSFEQPLYYTTTVAGNVVTNPSQSEYVYAPYTPATFLTNFEYTASRDSGCCRDCSLIGNDVQVYYWPTPAPAVADRTLVNSEGFTFVYPTLYIGLQSLYATDQCGTLSGQVVASTTIPIPEENLSTAIAYRYNASQYTFRQPNINPFYTKADFANQQTVSCEDITTALYFENYGGGIASTTFTDAEYYTVTYNPCSPTLSVPTELYTINPAWSTCVPGIRGLYDPPYSLQPGGGLVAFDPAGTTPAVPDQTTTSPPNDPPTTTPTSTPSPADTVTPPTATPTKTPVVVNPDPPATQSPADPGQSPPAQQTPPTDPGQSPADPGQSPPAQQTPPADPGQNNPPQNPGNPGQQQPTIPAVIIGTQTLLPGGPALTISGNTLSLDPSGSSIIIDGNTQDVPGFIASATAPEFIVGGSQTLIQGAPAITVSGTQVSLVAGGESVVIGGSVTEALSSFLGSQTVTATGDDDGLGGIIATVGGFPSESAGSNGGYTGPLASGGGKEREVWVWGTLLGAGFMGVWFL